jgi:cytochrome c-type biogenesis protein CcmF
VNSLLGQLSILTGLAAAGFGAVTGLIAGARQSRRGLLWTQRAAFVFAATMVLANLVMVYALLTHDFSVSYVAKVGSRSSPPWITVVSLWSSLEGSILFWGAVLGLFIGTFAWVYRRRYFDTMAYALGIALAVGAFFGFLLAGPAHPFAPVFPVPADGPGPNPLLQNHVLMVLHPPALYLGYVGMTVPIAIALAGVLRGKIGEGWLVPLRQWTLLPWGFLTLGIVLGSWWAYEVLGWGGYWAWDPVENASLIPWLMATAYLHANVLLERRRLLRVTTMTLVVLTFLLTILGTFMTRSGVFNSVHAFSQSAIGPLFLGFIGIAALFSLGAVAGRAHLLESEGRFERLWSRETAMAGMVVILAAFTFMVLLGTLYPLITEAVRGTKVSVGEPYFNKMTAPLGLLLVLLMGVGPALPWGKPRLRGIAASLLPPFGVALAVAGACLGAGLREALPITSFALCAFAFAVSLREIIAPVARRVRERRDSIAMALTHSISNGRRRIGAHLVHIGVLMVVVAITASHAYKQTVEASPKLGGEVALAGYTLTYLRTEATDEPHRLSVAAHFRISREGVLVAEVAPRLNYYPTQREPVGAPDVVTIAGRDLYLSLLSFESDGSQVAIKAFANPLVSWIWWSLPLFAVGTALGFWPRLRRGSLAANKEASP